jgi:hypothetical protein
MGWDALTVEVPSQQKTPVPRKLYVKSPCASCREKLCLGRSPKFSQGSIPTKCSSSRDVKWNLPVLDWSRKLCLGVSPNYILQFSAKVVRFRFITFPSSFAVGKGHVWGTFPNCGIRLSYRLIILDPSFWEWHHPGALDLISSYLHVVFDCLPLLNVMLSNTACCCQLLDSYCRS